MNWFNYFNRTYQQIKLDIIENLKLRVPELLDYSEGNIFILTISILSYLLEICHGYLDILARELFIVTAKRFVSIIKLANSNHYRVKAAIPSRATFRLSFLDSNGSLVSYPIPFNVPSGSGFQIGNYTFYTQKPLVVTSPMEIEAYEIEQVVATIGVSDGLPNQILLFNSFIGKNLVDSSTYLMIDNELWTSVDHFAKSNPLSKHFNIYMEIDGRFYIQFGDGQFGRIPTPNKDIEAHYSITSGPSANNIPPSTWRSLTTFTILSGYNLKVESINTTNNGKLYETAEEIRKHAINSLYTVDRAVTSTDYKYVLENIPIIGKSNADFCCNKNLAIQVYILPNSPELASISLRDETKLSLCKYSQIGDLIEIWSGGISYLKLSIDGIYKNGYSPNEANNILTQFLESEFEWQNQPMNPYLYRSNLIAKAINLGAFVNLNIPSFIVIPHIFPKNHNKQLVYTLDIIGGNSSHVWNLIFNGVKFSLYKDNIFETFIVFASTYNNGILEINIPLNVYATGTEWIFNTYTVDNDVHITDNSVIRLKDYTINLSSIQNASNCSC